MTEEKMFKLWKDKRIETVNPINGCEFDCVYCWAEKMAKRLQGNDVKGYENGFEPSWCPSRMEVPDADIVWIGSMGDLAFQPLENIHQIIEEMIEPNPDTTFFLETKLPSRYKAFIHKLPENVILSTTIESNEQPNWVSEAPGPRARYDNFSNIQWPKKHISIEPIMKFDMGTMVRWIHSIQPDIVSVGYDNYGCDLPEPSKDKTKELVEKLDKFTDVEEKGGI